MRKSEKLTILYFLLDNWQQKKRFAAGNYASPTGSTHAGFSLSESVTYVNEVFRDYLEFGGLNEKDLIGKKVFEAGVGDNFGVALKFLAAGAAKVVCLDRFYSHRDEQQQMRIYHALRAGLSPEGQARFDQAVSLSGNIRLKESRLKYVYGNGLEEADKLLLPETYDFIISRGVLQSVYNIDAAFAAMDRLLVPGGLMLHLVELRDQGMFSRGGLNPLTFLTIPDSLYELMSSHTGQPNRKRLDYYRNKIRELGYEAEFYPVRVFWSHRDFFPPKKEIRLNVDYTPDDVARIEAIRPRLLAQFQPLSTEDLLTAAFFLVARKPAV